MVAVNYFKSKAKATCTNVEYTSDNYEVTYLNCTKNQTFLHLAIPTAVNEKKASRIKEYKKTP